MVSSNAMKTSSHCQNGNHYKEINSMAVQPVSANSTLPVYRSWVNAWLQQAKYPYEPSEPRMSLEKLASLFRKDKILELLDYDQLLLAVHSFKKCLENGEILFGGTQPPSCEETNLASASYNPRSNCTCSGLFPIPSGTSVDDVVQRTGCRAIQKMIAAYQTVLEKKDEWNHSSLYSIDRFEKVAPELVLCNSETDSIPPLSSCRGSVEVAPIPSPHAPDRRPDKANDSQPAIYNLYYPTAEQVKLLTDAKRYLVAAANASVSDQGLVTAIADAGNDILIGDYCEAADDAGLKSLQQTGAAAIAFLKLCELGGIFSSWQVDNIFASTVLFRVVGCYRDHANLPGGIYGSRMNGILVHRYCDLTLFHGVVTASLATGEELSENVYIQLNEACTIINDLVDLRSDTARKQRENVVLRGVRGNICTYLDGLIRTCVERAVSVIHSSPVGARALMAYCNWAVMGSQHKLYELERNLTVVGQSPPCEYSSASDFSGYSALLDVLAPCGTLGRKGPCLSKSRVQMDLLYNAYCVTEGAHLAWLADMTRSLLNPLQLRKLCDVVHYEWLGDLGDVEYCP